MYNNTIHARQYNSSPWARKPKYATLGGYFHWQTAWFHESENVEEE